MSMLQEFKAFAMKGSVIDLAVGVIIGAAFGKIITSLVDDVIMPLFGIFLRGADFSKLALTVGDAHINYGLFIQSVVNFVIVTFCIFFIIKQANRFKKPVPVTSPTTPEDVVLLREIRDELKKRHA